MTTPAVPRLRFRLTLYRKITVGFAIIILIVAAAVWAVLIYPLKPLISTNQPQSQAFELSQELGQYFNANRDAAENYFRLKDRRNFDMLRLVEVRLTATIDSLAGIAGGGDVKRPLDELTRVYDRYRDVVEAELRRMSDDSSFDALATFQQTAPLEDSVRQRIEAVRAATLPGLYLSLKQKDRETETALTTSLVVLGISLVVVVVISWFIARALIRPLKALTAGAEKVGEGRYENVPITSDDETADLARAFNLMSDKLRQLDEMRMQLMSEISHEMRTPLQVIKAGCYSIVHTKDGPALTQRQRDAVGMIHQATNRINQFINSFLDVAKMEAGLMKFKFEASDLVEMVTPLIQEAQLIGQTRQINVEFHAGEIPPLMIDKERMGQVFSNLLSNALKYTPDHGSITISISRTAGCAERGGANKPCVAIEVRDTGVGIPEADLGNLFIKFYQAKNVPLVNEKGSGLGLALVKHVAEAHGGSVSVKSQVGVGSTFTVLLPEDRT